MEKKDTKLMSNNELQIYMKTLENEFEAMKIKIQNMCDELKEIDKEYSRVKNELGIRQGNIY